MSVEINATNFPDANFRQYISETYDPAGTGIISDSKLSSIYSMKFTSYAPDSAEMRGRGTGWYRISSIGSLAGIEFFENLISLDILNVSIPTAVNLSALSKLRDIFIYQCGITAITLPQYNQDSYSFIHITLAYNNLHTIDLSTIPSNQDGLWLRLSDNPLTSIDLSGINAIEDLMLSNTSITSLDLSGVRNLESVYAAYCDQLTTVIFGDHPILRQVGFAFNTKLANVTLGKCPQLNDFSIHSSKVPELNISRCELLIESLNYRDTTATGVQLYDSKDAHTPRLYLCVPNRTVLLTEAIQITKQPEDQTIEENGTAIFVVSAFGEGALSYQWMRYNADNDAFESMPGKTAAVLSVGWDELTEPYSGMVERYMCTISNDDLWVGTNEVTLTVLGPPFIINSPDSISVTEGNTCQFTVEASGYQIVYQWQASSNNGLTWNDIQYAQNPVYEIVAMGSLNGFQYRCVVSNEYGTVNSNAATLTVNANEGIAAPVISVNPVNATVDEGQTAMFTVAAEGDDLSYQWQVQKDGGWQSIQGATGTSYNVVGTRQLNGSKYRCLVANAAGAVYSLDAMLTVNQQSYISTPRILTQPRSATVALGDTVSFIVRADGGELSYQWQRLNGGQWYDLTGQTASACILTATSDLDGTQYRCAVSNTAGTTYTNIVLLSLTEGPIVNFYGYHSIIISGKNTYGEWEMYPTSRPHIAPPEVKTSYVDLPGADGGIDYTDLLTGEPRYGYRKGSWEFLLIPQDKWASVYRSLVSFLHGKVHTVILEDDPNYVYTGRLSVNEWQSAAHNSLITIDYILEPFPKNISGEDPSESDEEVLNAAERLLRKPENAGMVIGIVNNTASIIDPAILFPDGDSIAY